MNSLNDIWNSILTILGESLTPTAMNTWFSDCVPVDLQNNRLVIHTPTEFKRKIIQNRFAEAITRALGDLFSAEFQLVILAGDELEGYLSESRMDDSLPEVAGFTFDNFVVGPSNKFAHAAAMAVSDNPVRYTTLCLSTGTPALARPTSCWPSGNSSTPACPGQRSCTSRGTTSPTT